MDIDNVIENIKKETRYTFRGMTIIVWNPDKKTIHFTPDAYLCGFIQEDTELIIKFLTDCVKGNPQNMDVN